MSSAIKLPKYSLGVGDRFAHQAKAQLRACMQASESGVEVIPVWNKSNREHAIIGSEPVSTRVAADAAVKALAWTKPYFCDADHIGIGTVDRFFNACDFFTIDVADFIGNPAEPSIIDSFLKSHLELLGEIKIDGIDQPLTISTEFLQKVSSKFLAAIQQAASIYKKIEANQGAGNFVTEVSMDETDSPQTPAELLIILAAAADAGIPLQTIAPKFSGRFNKGVDYVGNVTQFEKEFALDVATIAHAVKHYDLPQNLKLSVHSGSDKFSIYAPIHRTIQRFDTGVHLKTAGTTWLEELIGLAEAGDESLDLAKEIYKQAYDHREELCAPYATVINIDPAKLPTPNDVARWSSDQYTAALRHNPESPGYNNSLRQLLHVGFKVAAKMGSRYLELLDANEAIIARNVTENLFDRHIAPVFLGRHSS
ncbi:hypothetical protein H7849_12825 [Alloacidobacterium dinghuense]|uniref:Tagaturonate/fructuronate epimerase n=1 Tax=Alloacidobacterium dinghuense TaxID=2763107 RepID=A0A7G8BQ73_9BACT|nr:tagaturonate epimerase family protein [Alloacidobacterium dinghuense]QNI34693.1 hypothetical protein H7849_12825 [Alloacidobacterium dinghuense]